MPAMVIEEIIKRNLQGEETEYKINLAGQTQVFLNSIPDVHVFDDLQKARQTLVNRVVSVIDELVQEVETATRDLFPEEIRTPHLIDQDDKVLDQDVNI